MEINLLWFVISVQTQKCSSFFDYEDALNASFLDYEALTEKHIRQQPCHKTRGGMHYLNILVVDISQIESLLDFSVEQCFGACFHKLPSPLTTGKGEKMLTNYRFI